MLNLLCMPKLIKWTQEIVMRPAAIRFSTCAMHLLDEQMIFHFEASLLTYSVLQKQLDLYNPRCWLQHIRASKKEGEFSFSERVICWFDPLHAGIDWIHRAQVAPHRMKSGTVAVILINPFWDWLESISMC